MASYDPDQHLNTADAAALIGRKPKTLENWRARKCGPAFHRVRRAVSYKVADLQAFMAAHRQQVEA